MEIDGKVEIYGVKINGKVEIIGKHKYSLIYSFVSTELM